MGKFSKIEQLNYPTYYLHKPERSDVQVFIEQSMSKGKLKHIGAK
jgi:hypothetical protein